MEIWTPIQGFEGYEVSSMGYVRRSDNREQLSMSYTHDGSVKVNMSANKRQYTRSVRRLVAEAFVSKPNEKCDTPINLDGDPTHNWSSNLAWRPRGYAWEYAHQFSEPPHPKYNIPIYNKHTAESFTNVMEAGIYYGLLWRLIYTSCVTGRQAYPSHYVFGVL